MMIYSLLIRKECWRYAVESLTGDLSLNGSARQGKLADKENLTWMKKAGCSMIAYGVESGNQKAA